MTDIRTFKQSFSGGEVSEEMFGRLADAKFQTGLSLCKNFTVRPQGPVQNRPGLEFVREVKDSTKETRLIPFVFSADQTLVIEMGEEYFRWYTQGAVLQYATAGVVTWAPLANFSTGDKVLYSGVYYHALQDSTAQQPDISPTYWYPLPVDLTYEIPHPFAEEDLFEVKYVQSGDVITFTHPDYTTLTLTRAGADEWYTAEVDFGSIGVPPINLVVTKTGSGTGYSYSYVVTRVSTEGEETEASAVGTVASSNLATSGTKNSVAFTPVPPYLGTSHYNVYKSVGGIYGYIGRAPTSPFVDDNIAADTSITPPIFTTGLPPSEAIGGTDDDPGAVGYYEQRKVFGGTNNQPQMVWMTKSGTEYNMSFSLPARDDDRINFRIAARQANVIKHIVPLQELILLTSSTEYRVTSVNSDALTPTSIAVRPQSYVGASDVQPITANNSLLFAAARGGHVIEMAYNWQANGYATADVSLRATHLFDEKTIVDMAYQKAPFPIVWFVNDEGLLLGFTYVPDQRIGAWHQHETINGEFESCAVVPEGDEDHLYVIVRRLIDGSYVRYVERMASRYFSTREDAFFVDSGLSYDGNNTVDTDLMTLTTATTWDLGEVLTLTASGAHTPFVAGDVNDQVVITHAGVEYTLTITGYTSSTVVSVITDKAIPASLQSTGVSTWAFARLDLSGLSHLEGETVAILADGGTHPTRVVASGAITLQAPATVVHVGLPIVADIETLPMFTQAEGALGQGRVKNINEAWVRVYNSAGFFIGPDSDNLVEAKIRTTEPYGSPPDLASGEVDVVLHPQWQYGGHVYIRQSDPLPLTVSSITMEVSVGG